MSDHARSATLLIRPQATSPPRTKLSPIDDATRDDSDESSKSSVGARGIPLALDTSVMSESDDSCDDESVDDVGAHESDDIHEAGYNAEKEDDGEDAEIGDNGEIDDDELSSIMESLVDRLQDTDSVASNNSERHIGVIQDRVDLVTIPKTKRVLSFTALNTLGSDFNRIRDSQKKQRSGKEAEVFSRSLISFTLGPPASSEDPGSLTEPSRILEFRVRQESPMISSSDDEVLLQAELGVQAGRSHDNSPVPLLTPPDSPLTVEINGTTTTICEWPSNLVVDSAMAAAMNELRPSSAASLGEFENEDDSFDDNGVVLVVEGKAAVAKSTLTPLLTGISVTER